jgi:hypothetical protein
VAVQGGVKKKGFVCGLEDATKIVKDLCSVF